MKPFKSKAAIALVGVLALGSYYALAAGNYSMYPVVGSAAICAGTVTGTGGLGGNTGQGQGSIGSICPLSIPAGPSIVTGNELIPADTEALPSGSHPQTVVLTLASLNSLPLTLASVNNLGELASYNLTPTSTSGGIIISPVSNSGNTLLITGQVNVFLPATPIDGQQFRIASAGAAITSTSATPTSLVVALSSAATAGTTILNGPIQIVTSTTGNQGYTYWYNAANLRWIRLQ